MHFTVAGVHRYSVRVANQRVYDREDNEVEGLAIESRRLIVISPLVEPGRREEVLLHELHHAWEFHLNLDGSEEQRSQTFAAIAQQLRIDLENNGGVQALQALEPEPISLPHGQVSRRKTAAPGPLQRVEGYHRCGCDAPLPFDAIKSSEPRQVDELQMFYINRWCECESCNGLATWREQSTPAGEPMGMPMQNPPPRVLHGNEKAKWLAQVKDAIVFESA